MIMQVTDCPCGMSAVKTRMPLSRTWRPNVLTHLMLPACSCSRADYAAPVTIYGGIEAGGTKWVCALANGPDDVRETVTFATTTPDETLGRAVEFFASNSALAAVGVGSFGPVDLASGRITTTPKPGWSNTEVVAALQRALHVPVAFDTDVNAAALGEHRWGAAVGLDTFCYVTVGTGIGGGAMVNGGLLHGLHHPEFGHMRVPHD